MNKYRREELMDVVALLEEAADRLCEIHDDEQEAFDNMPEGLQCGSRGDSMMEALDEMDGWVDEIGQILNKIQNYAGK